MLHLHSQIDVLIKERMGITFAGSKLAQTSDQGQLSPGSLLLSRQIGKLVRNRGCSAKLLQEQVLICQVCRTVKPFFLLSAELLPCCKLMLKVKFSEFHLCLQSFEVALERCKGERHHGEG